VTGLAGRPAALPCRPVHRLDIIEPSLRSCRSPNESNHAAGPSRTRVGRRLTAKRAASQRSARGHCTRRASSACAAVRVTTSGVCQNAGRRVRRIGKEARPRSAAVSRSRSSAHRPHPHCLVRSDWRSTLHNRATCIRPRPRALRSFRLDVQPKLMACAPGLFEDGVLASCDARRHVYNRSSLRQPAPFRSAPCGVVKRASNGTVVCVGSDRQPSF
jgi:hypothetical protein